MITYNPLDKKATDGNNEIDFYCGSTLSELDSEILCLYFGLTAPQESSINIKRILAKDGGEKDYFLAFEYFIASEYGTAEHRFFHCITCVDPRKTNIVDLSKELLLEFGEDPRIDDKLIEAVQIKINSFNPV